MSDNLDPLILDLLEWVGSQPRSQAEVRDAWRTSCPRLPVWEDCIDRGFVTREHQAGLPIMVALTPMGRRFLGDNGRVSHA